MIVGTTSLKLDADLIAFHQLYGDHDGESLAAMVLQLLDRARITAGVCPQFSTIYLPTSDISLKVGHFTLDNASNNQTMMEALERQLNKRDIPFDAKDCRIMCYAHISNLSSGHVIRAAGDGEGASEYNPIGRACGVVRAIRVSGKCQEAFDEVV